MADHGDYSEHVKSLMREAERMPRHATVWHLTARCRECAAPVRIRNTEHAMRMLDLAERDPQIGPDDVIQTYQCARKLPDGELCNALVEIRLRHWRKNPT